MYMSLKVLEAIAVLREAAENDFERHRLDVLMRDLTSPPTIEKVDDTHQKFNNVIYYRHKDGHYTFHHSLHRVIWEYHHGEIPKGYTVHHIDENKSNNSISNFQLLTASAHKSLHNLTTSKKEYICEFCGEKFLSSALNSPRFCSSKCNSDWHKKNEKEIRQCPTCGKTFSVYKHARQIYCSHDCANQVTSQKKKRPTIERTCVICGKKFIVPKTHSKQLCCSRLCGGRFVWQKRKATQSPLAEDKNNHL